MKQLLEQQRTLMISSIGEQKEPAISYAPFVKVGEQLFIYISKAAEHYHNICKEPQVAVMIIEDEMVAKSKFARQRVSFNCTAHKLEEVTEEIWEKFDSLHGSEMMTVLKSLDFDVFQLDILKGRLVKGFGKAYDIQKVDGKLEQIQVTEMAHKQQMSKRNQ